MDNRSLLEKVSESIVSLIDSNARQGGKMEVEARLGYHTEKGFTANVRRANWMMCRDALDRLGLQKQVMKIVSESYGQSGYRKRTITSNDITTTIFEGKFSTRPIEDINNWTRYSFSIELPVPKIPEGIIVEPTIRTIERTRYVFGKYQCFVDISKSESNFNLFHEIEIEMIQPNRQDYVKHFLACVRRVTMMMNGTSNYYNIEQLRTLNFTINSYLPVDTDKPVVDPLTLSLVTNRKILSDARPLNMYDLAVGKIIGGSVLYGATWKTDGVRFLLVFAHHSVWLVSPPYHVNLLTTQVQGIIGENEFSIFEVEVLDPYANILDVWILDALTVGGITIRSLPSHKERLRKGQEFITDVMQRRVLKTPVGNNQYLIRDVTLTGETGNVTMFPPIFNINWKKITVIKTVDDFHDIMTYLSDNKPDPAVHPTDGIMLIPSNYPYDYEIFIGITENERNKKKPILKWKEPKEITIDLRILRDNSEETVLLYEDRDETMKPKEVPFTGTPSKPFDVSMLLKESIPEIMYGGIGEFEWNPEIEKLVFRKPRELKAAPNGKRTALDNWLLVRNPITIKTITGMGLDQLRFYHNRIKDLLFAYSDGILLDLGAGRGGDIGKWKKGYRLVFAVEPNKEHIEKLRKRAYLAGFIERQIGDRLDIDDPMFVVINTVAQDTQLIIQTIHSILNPYNFPNISSMVDTVSMMDVGTFFWENSTVLSQVVDTVNYALKPGGLILWKMMDGDAVRDRFARQKRSKQSYKSFFSPLTQNDILEYGDFTVQATGLGNQVEVTFEGGIVGERQTEYLTRISDFYRILGPLYKVELQERADQPSRILLSGESKLVSSLYIYGIISRKEDGSEKDKKSPLKEIVEEVPQTTYIPYENTVPPPPLVAQLLTPQPLAHQITQLPVQPIQQQFSSPPPQKRKQFQDLLKRRNPYNIQQAPMRQGQQ